MSKISSKSKFHGWGSPQFLSQPHLTKYDLLENSNSQSLRDTESEIGTALKSIVKQILQTLMDADVWGTVIHLTKL